MYLYVSEIFPTEIRPIGMGFSLFGQFAGKSITHSEGERHLLNHPSYTNPSGNGTYGLQQCWLEILSCHHLLVCLLHSG
jgi:hypothetical protein